MDRANVEKTTLARQFALTRDAVIFDLESEPDVRRDVAETLAFDHLFVVCPRPSAYPGDSDITVLPITDVVHLPTRIVAL